MDHLPLVLLGIRTSVREDTGLCPAELVYGSVLRLPGEFLTPPEDPASALSSEFVARLRHNLASHRPPQALHHRPPGPAAVVPAVLESVPFVFVRVDAALYWSLQGALKAAQDFYFVPRRQALGSVSGPS